MGLAFFARRFAVALGVAFTGLLVAELMKGHGTRAALSFAAAWGALTATAYVAALAYRLRRNAACVRRPEAAGSGQKPGPLAAGD
jgi:hypothetical protein